MTTGASPKEKILKLGYSPCPNDTFIFNAIAQKDIKLPGFTIKTELHDVQTLNRMAETQVLDITKLSFYAFLKVQKNYALLNSGAALGYGCGPLVVSKKKLGREDMPHCRVALPGEETTAHLLFSLWAQRAEDKVFVTYDQIFDEVIEGRADCGVIIHENRFTYQEKGLRAVVDLGAWWEGETHLPIPLGCMAAKKDLGESLIADIEGLIVQSMQRGQADPKGALPYIRQYAQEMDETVLRQHIETFVNAFSLDLGEAGRKAVETLAQKAQEAGII